MIQEMLVYHTVMIKLFLLLLIVNLWVPWIFRSERYREIKATRITFFFFSAMVTMVAFTGAVLALITEASWNFWIVSMIFVWILLSIVEVLRSQKLTQAWLADRSAVSFSWHYVAIEIVLVAGMVLIAVLKA